MLQNLATVAADAGRSAESASAWRQALALRPPTAASFRAAAAAFERAGELAEASRALASAAEREPSNWQHHYAHAHALMRMAATEAAEVASDAGHNTAGWALELVPGAPPRDGGRGGSGGGSGDSGVIKTDGGNGVTHGRGGAGDSTWHAPPSSLAPSFLVLEQRALSALAPISREPISLHARLNSSAVPLWMRDGGRGVRSDGPPPRAPAELLAAQAGRRAEAAAAGRQRGVILYKLGGSEAEMSNLKLSLWRLDR
eukprot:scaffold10399_cov94-Isochrysis_galbana.AAC.10